MRRFWIPTLLLLCALVSAPAQAAYPDRPVKLVIPFATGGSPDPIARLLANELTAQLGVQVIVENRPGGTSTIGTSYVARSRPDGYTLLFASPTQAIASRMFTSPGFDLTRDFYPVSKVASSPAIIVVDPALPVRTVAELVDYLKANPGKAAYGAAGIGTTAHLTIEMFRQATETEIKEVQYRSVEQVMTDVMGGRLTMGAGFPSALVPMINAGRLRALAVTSSNRLPQLPDVPTTREAGIASVEVDAWYGVLAPAATPREITDRLNREIGIAVAKISSKLIESSVLPAPSTSEAFGALLTSELAKWSAAVENARIPLQ